MTQNPLFATQSERVERLRAQLTGEPGVAEAAGPRTARAARGLTLSPSANLLYGMTLRAAARRTQGETLTELEESLVALLRVTGSTDAEIADFGEVFLQHAKAEGTTALFTTHVSERSLSEGFSVDDLAAILPELAPEITAQPTFLTVRVDTLGPEEDLDSPAAAQARAEFGGGVIAFLTEDNMGGFSSNPTPLNATVAYNNFHVIRRDHDGVTNPRNEIYWASGTGSDRSKTDYKSDEFKEIEDGSRRDFPSGANFFTGEVKNALTGHIQCWEADDSSGGFYNSLRQAMRDTSDYCFKTSEKLEHQNEEYNGGSAFLSLVGLLARLVDAILGWATNDDDLLSKVDLAFSASAVHVMSGRTPANNRIRFLGQGNPSNIDLYLRVVMPVGPAFPLRQRILTGTSWGPATTPPGLSASTAVALASHAGKLHALFAAPGSFRLVHSTLTGNVWSTPVGWAGAASPVAPALVSDGTDLHAVHVGGGGTMFYNKLTANGWTQFATLSGMKSVLTPALTYIGGRLDLQFVNPDGVMHQVTDLTGQRSPVTMMKITNGDAIHTAHAPRAVNYNGRLNLFYRSVFTPGLVVRLVRGNSDIWASLNTNTGWRTTKGPGVAVHDNKIYCVMNGSSGELWGASFNGSAWSSATQMGGTAIEETTLAAHAGNLHLMYRA